MSYTDIKNQATSHPSIGGTTVAAAAITGTAVDLANKYAAAMMFTFGSSAAGTGAYAPWLHESNDPVTGWGTVAAAEVTSARHGSLVGTAVPPTGQTWLMGYTGSKRYIRAFINAGGVTQAGTAVGGTANASVSATVISFANGIVPVSGQ